MTLKQMFEEEAHQTLISGEPQILVVAVKLPSGAIELITNTKNLDMKISYYRDAYDKEFKLRANPNVQIVNYMIV